MMRLEVRGARKAERRLGRMSRAVRLAAYRALKRTAVTARKLGAQQIGRELNLKRTYIRDKLKIVDPTTDRLQAVIKASKTRVLLTRYDARQLVRAAPGAKGSPIRGIPPGRKAAGVSVKVKRAGPRRKLRAAFLAPLGTKKSGERILGVAIRTGRTRRGFRVLYGPSVDQAWKSVRRQVLDEIQPLLERRFADELRHRLRRL